MIEVKCGKVVRVAESTRNAKFCANPSMGGFWVNRWNIRKNVYSLILF